MAFFLYESKMLSLVGCGVVRAVVTLHRETKLGWSKKALHEIRQPNVRTISRLSLRIASLSIHLSDKTACCTNLGHREPLYDLSQSLITWFLFYQCIIHNA